MAGASVASDGTILWDNNHTGDDQEAPNGSASVTLHNVTDDDFYAKGVAAGLLATEPFGLSLSGAYTRFEPNSLDQMALTSSPSGIEVVNAGADLSDFRNPGGWRTASERSAIRVKAIDQGLSIAWEGYSLNAWDEEPTNKHTIYGRRIELQNYAKRVIGTKPNGSLVVYKQAANCVGVGCGTMNEVNGNSGGFLVEAYHAPEVLDLNGNIILGAGIGRLFGQQTVVRVRGGTDPGPDRINIADINGDDGDEPVDDYSYGYGHTVNMSGKFRSWAGMFMKGRPGIADSDDEGGGWNGLVIDGKDEDGNGGVHGGRGYWHIGLAAIYGKDEAPGWITIAWDGIDPAGIAPSGGLGPIDIHTDLTPGQTGLVYCDGLQVLGIRNRGWTPMTGTATKGGGYDTASVTLPQLAAVVNAMQVALTTHGLLGPT